jgi:deoxyribonuclease V
MTLAAFDTHYLEDGRASAAAVVFKAWGDGRPSAEYHCMLAGSAAYVPGAFYRRELPGILALVDRIASPLATLVVDGYVTLGTRPGLGRHLFEALGGRIAVIGVAKSEFTGSTAALVLRGLSRRPLYVTAAGLTADTAAARIRAMHGSHRIPTLLRRVDRLARETAG